MKANKTDDKNRRRAFSEIMAILEKPGRLDTQGHLDLLGKIEGFCGLGTEGETDDGSHRG